MSEIIIEKNLTTERIESLAITSWEIWECPVTEFRLDFDEIERSYILEGEIVVTPDDGEPVTIVPGDYVIFPVGLKSMWKVTKQLKKHYTHTYE
jgi:uncharacterized cupin superfamily protein